jgi:5-methylcytosine-specific restriction endonuclease McrA
MAEEDVSDLPRTHKEALANGSTRYFTGNPCSRGHVTFRFTANKSCGSCSRAKTNERRARDPDLTRKSARKRYWENVEKRRKVAREWAKAHADAIRERNLADPKFKERSRVTQRKWRALNPEKARKAEKTWQAKNREKMRAASVAYDKANPERARARWRNRSARKRKAEGRHSAADVAHIRRAQKDKCGYCRADLAGKGHVDHITALSRGGSNLPRNLQLLCEGCNLSKNSKDPIDFARSIGKLL